MSDAAREAVARAIGDHYGFEPEWQGYLPFADKLIAAHESVLTISDLRRLADRFGVVVSEFDDRGKITNSPVVEDSETIKKLYAEIERLDALAKERSAAAKGEGE